MLDIYPDKIFPSVYGNDLFLYQVGFTSMSCWIYSEKLFFLLYGFEFIFMNKGFKSTSCWIYIPRKYFPPSMVMTNFYSEWDLNPPDEGYIFGENIFPPSMAMTYFYSKRDLNPLIKDIYPEKIFFPLYGNELF